MLNGSFGDLRQLNAGAQLSQEHMDTVFRADEHWMTLSRRVRDLPDGTKDGVTIPSGADSCLLFAEAYLRAADHIANVATTVTSTTATCYYVLLKIS